MIRLFVRHQVEDYDRWKEAYDGFGAVQKEMGVRAEAVYQGVDDPREVTAWHDFDDVETARAFVASPRLREAMEAAGVVGEPTIWITKSVL